MKSNLITKLVVSVLILTVLGFYTFSTPEKQDTSAMEDALALSQIPGDSVSGSVLGEQDENPIFFTVNVPSRFKKDISAPNIVYSITGGEGITVTEGQDPTLSNTGVLSLQDQTGDLSLIAGAGIEVNGLTISNALSFIGSGGTTISRIGDSVTVSSSAPDYTLSGWSKVGTSVGLTTVTNNVIVDSLTFGNATITNGKSIKPDTDLGSDLGSAALRFNNLYVGNINSNSSTSTAGQATFTYEALSTALTEASVLINPTAPVANGQLLGLSVAGYQRALIDEDGDLTLGYNDAISAPASDYPLSVYGHNGTQVSFIDTTGGAYFAGDVGIGIAPSAGTALYVGGHLMVKKDKVIQIKEYSVTYLQLKNVGNDAWINAPSGNLSLQNISGNVGIGTTTPETALHISEDGILRLGTVAAGVSGAVEIISTSNLSEFTDVFRTYYGSTQVFEILVSGGNNINSWQRGTVLANAVNGRWMTIASDNIRFMGGTSNDTVYMDILSSGDIGIGIPGPEAKLHIVGNTDDQQLIVRGNATQTTNIIEIQNSSGIVLGGRDKEGRLLSYARTGSATNFFAGLNAGKATSTGLYNNAIGYQTLMGVTSGGYNNAIGEGVLYSNQTGTNNTAIGQRGLRSNTTGWYNTVLGHQPLYYSQTGTGNIGIGSRTGGYGTGLAFTGADYNIILGHEAGYNLNTDMDRNIYIGYQAGYDATGSDQLYIDNSSSASPLIWGDFANDVMTVNGKLGLGDVNPAYKLDVFQDSINIAAGASTHAYRINDKRIFSTDGTNVYFGDIDNLGGGSTGSGYFYTAGSLKMRISGTGGLSLGSAYTGTDPGAGSAIFSGNVGIGTGSPGAKLHVSANIGTIPTLSTDNIALFQNNIDGFDGVGITLLSKNNGVGRIDFGNETDADRGSIQYNHTTPKMVFVDNGTEVMTLRDGDIEIGFNKGLKWGSTTTTELRANQGYYYFNYQGLAELTLNTNATSATFLTNEKTVADFRIQTTGTGKHISLNPTGNVGIGIDDPGEKLEISGSGEIYSKITTTSNGSKAGIKFAGNAKSGSILLSDSDGSLRFSASGVADAVYIAQATGYVGIGNTPSYSLDVTGMARATEGVVTYTKAGTISDVDFTEIPIDGLMGVDSTNGRLYFRHGGAWHYVAQTAGFQIPEYETYTYDFNTSSFDTSSPLADGDFLIPFVEGRMSDGAIHGLYTSFSDVKDQLFAEELSRILSLETRVTALEAGGGLSTNPLLSSTGTIGSIATWTDTLWTFLGNVSFNGSVILPADTAGTVTIPAGSQETYVAFTAPYDGVPVVTTSILSDSTSAPAVLGQKSSYAITNIGVNGFTISLLDPAIVDTSFSWIAILTQ